MTTTESPSDATSATFFAEPTKDSTITFGSTHSSTTATGAAPAARHQFTTEAAGTTTATSYTDAATTFAEGATISSTVAEAAGVGACVEAGCEHLCRETEDGESAECLCRDGYVLSEDGKTCDDVDECLDGSNGGCGMHCWNVPGSYQCLCAKGFVLENDGKKCRGKSALHKKVALFLGSTPQSLPKA